MKGLVVCEPCGSLGSLRWVYEEVGVPTVWCTWA